MADARGAGEPVVTAKDAMLGDQIEVEHVEHHLNASAVCRMWYPGKVHAHVRGGLRVMYDDGGLKDPHGVFWDVVDPATVPVRWA
jgi:hypothetical protein